MPPDVYGLIAEKRDEILAVAERYGIMNVWVFGSVARHEAREDSDLDLLVTSPATASLFDMIGLEQDLTELLGLEVQVASDRGLSGSASARPSSRKRCRCEVEPRPVRQFGPIDEGLDEGGGAGRRVLFVEPDRLDAAGEPVRGERPVVQVREEEGGDPEIVLDHVLLSEPGAGKTTRSGWITGALVCFRISSTLASPPAFTGSN